MSLKNILSNRQLSTRKFAPAVFILVALVSGCSPVAPSTPTAASAPTQVEVEPTQTSVDETTETFSSDALGICFSYPQGYNEIPYNDTVEIAAPVLPGSDMMGLFWLEKSEANGRTAQQAADEELAIVPGLNVGRWSVSLGGEEALVLDGMPGQDLQRRAFIVHGDTLYILAFMPTLSENQAANEQVETLYKAVTSSWQWSACSQ